LLYRLHCGQLYAVDRVDRQAVLVHSHLQHLTQHTGRLVNGCRGQINAQIGDPSRTTTDHHQRFGLGAVGQRPVGEV
jgi:hypothetical protein